MNFYIAHNDGVPKLLLVENIVSKVNILGHLHCFCIHIDEQILKNKTVKKLVPLNLRPCHNNTIF